MSAVAIRSPRLYLLDVLRGLAAAIVVVYHYQHFFYLAPATAPPPFPLGMIYEHGGAAVQLFFVISGFIFYRLYGEAIRERRISAGAFAILRLSRLYPLHAATLVLVALLQARYVATAGAPFTYADNDAPHFILQAVFASSWGILPGNFSFNGPSWSISVEVACYAIFFVACLLARRNWLVSAALCLAGLLVAEFLYPPIGVGMFCYFAGGLACLAYEAVKRHGWTAQNASAGAVVLLLGAAATALILPDLGAYDELFVFGPMFAAVVLTCVTAQDLWPSAGRTGKFLGDVSYAMYLIHFPIQLTIALLWAAGAIRPDFNDPICVVAYLALVIAVAIPTYRLFELPIQNLIRRSALGRPANKQLNAAG